MAPARPHAFGAGRRGRTPARADRPRRSRRSTPVLSRGLAGTEPGEDAGAATQRAVLFKPTEIQTLQEVLSDYYAQERANGHRCATAWDDDGPIGFVYWAPAPMTDRSWYLYWIAVRRDFYADGDDLYVLRKKLR